MTRTHKVMIKNLCITGGVDVKVVDVTSTILKLYEYPYGGWVLVRMKTDNGYLDKGFKRIVVGEDLMDVEKIWEKMDANCKLALDS